MSLKTLPRVTCTAAIASCVTLVMVTGRSAQAQSDTASVQYDRFTDSASVTVGHTFPWPRALQPDKPDSLSVTLGVLVRGRSVRGKPYKPYLTAVLTRETSSTIPGIDSSDALFLLLDQKTRISAKLRHYSFHDLSMVHKAVELISYALTRGQLQALARARSIEARIGHGDPLEGADALAGMAATVLRRVGQQ